MTEKPMYQYIFEMLDYADRIAALIQPGEYDNENYFMTLIYIEDILDKYGRGIAYQGASGGEDSDGHDRLVLATKRMDLLREQIRHFSQMYDFDEAIKDRGDSMYRNWHKRP